MLRNKNPESAMDDFMQIRSDGTWLTLQIVTEGKSTSDNDAVVSSIEVMGFCCAM